ncbi:MAG: type II toxin-antitoxin system Phd/YefM family antitoxin [Pseudohongiellaceae bacterium]
MTDKMWSLHEAKNRFSAVVDAALHGHPQWVTRRGKPVGVVLSVEDYERLKLIEKASAPSFARLLLEIPQDDQELERAELRLRDVAF